MNEMFTISLSEYSEYKCQQEEIPKSHSEISSLQQLQEEIALLKHGCNSDTAIKREQDVFGTLE
jgi:hypothetical protein